MKRIVLLLILIGLACGSVIGQDEEPGWKDILKEQIELHGHRNWILVVDAAYPYQSKPAIKTIATGDKQLGVVREVLKAVDRAPHVYAEVFLDKEIDYVPEEEAKGIDAYRKNLLKMLEGRNVSKELHEELIAMIDEAATVFNILVLKTELTIPYTSVFIRLDCGYWNAEQEKMLRERMKNNN